MRVTVSTGIPAIVTQLQYRNCINCYETIVIFLFCLPLHSNHTMVFSSLLSLRENAAKLPGPATAWQSPLATFNRKDLSKQANQCTFARSAKSAACVDAPAAPSHGTKQHTNCYLRHWEDLPLFGLWCCKSAAQCRMAPCKLIRGLKQWLGLKGTTIIILPCFGT